MTTTEPSAPRRTVPDSSGQSQGDVRGAVRLVLGLCWFALPLWCVFQAFGLLFHLFGESATPAEQAAAARWLTAAAVVAVAAPVLALLLRGGRRWLVALLLGAAFAGFAAVAAAGLTPDPPPAPRPQVCQERSGGDSDCPGG